MEKNSIKALLVFAVLLLGFIVGTEGGREMPTNDQVYSPQFLGLGGLLGGLGPLGFPFPFGLGLGLGLPFFGHFPFLTAPKDNANAGLKDTSKGNNRGANGGSP